MAEINILSKEIYNQISAGEVVERPASVVKELFENSIDAGAKNITVMIENGGINSIVVQDDGDGIDSDQLEKVFLPHATSKISSVKDLNAICTLGFRGEAMASIASVSKVRLVSKTENNDIGSFIYIEGGEIVEKGEVQCDKGTKVTVTGIFYNTPARLNFLKSNKSEQNEITSIMEKLILSNPYVSVKYYVDDKLIFQSYGDGLKNAIIAVYSAKTAENCIEISTEKNGIKIEGFLGNVNFYKSNKSYQTLIVNGRCVFESTASMALANVYNTYLMKRQYPFYVISLTVPEEIVDVNVHPRKAEVRFSSNQIVYSAVYSTVMKVLDGTAAALEIVKSSVKELYGLDEIPLGADGKPVQVDMFVVKSDLERKRLEEEQKKQELVKESPKIDDNSPKSISADTPYKVKPIPKSKPSEVADHYVEITADFTNEEYMKKLENEDIFAENKRYIEEQEALANAKQQQIPIEDELDFYGSIFDTYLLYEYGKEIILVDQHAAHERIKYDELLEKVEKMEVVRQPLIIPYCITVNAKELDMVYDLMDPLREMGFAIEFFDKSSFRIFTVPQGFEELEVERFMLDIVNDSTLKTEKVPQIIKEKLMQKACKSAIKAGDRLNSNEIEILEKKLKENLALKCPHGRPVAVRISKTEIDKWFKRIV